MFIFDILTHTFLNLTTATTVYGKHETNIVCTYFRLISIQYIGFLNQLNYRKNIFSTGLNTVVLCTKYSYYYK